MAESFLGLNKIAEYFHNTVVYVEGELVYLNDISLEANGQIHLRGISKTVNEFSQTFKVKTYDDCLNYLAPFLPRTQYFTDSKGNDWLCGYSPRNGYKRSLSSDRYRVVLPSFAEDSLVGRMVNTSIRNVKNYNCVESKSLVEVLEDPETEGITALSCDFAVYEGSSSRRPLILYQSFPIARVNNYGVIEVHPKYYHPFKNLLRGFGEVSDACS